MKPSQFGLCQLNVSGLGQTNLTHTSKPFSYPQLLLPFLKQGPNYPVSDFEEMISKI